MFSQLFCRCLKYLNPGADDFFPRIIHHCTPCPSSDELCPSTTITFDGLPYDVVGLIFGKLPIGDRVRMRLVSKSWRDRLVRSDFPVKPEPPWRILPIIDDSFDQPKHLTTEFSFESMSEERTYHFELPSNGSVCGGRYRWCCCGSSSDGGSWLLMAGREGNDHDLSSTTMMLWDPISGSTKRLPALTTLPFFAELVETCVSVGLENISTSEVIARAQVFSVGSCVVVAVLFVTKPDNLMKQHRLALCSPEDQSWSVVTCGPDDDYMDILFHKGKLHTVCRILRAVATSNNSAAPTNTTGFIKWLGPVAARRTRNCMVRLSCCCDVEVIMLDLVYEYDQHHAGDQEEDHVGCRKLVEKCNVVEHLVGSSTTGELLVVSAVFDNYSYDSGGRGPFPSHTLSKTKGFEVYGLDVNNANNCLERLRNVGKQSIFVGATGSTSVEAAAGGDYGNVIHFATNDAGGIRRIYEEQFDDSDDDEQYDIEEDDEQYDIEEDDEQYDIEEDAAANALVDEEEDAAANALVGEEEDAAANALVDEEEDEEGCFIDEWLVVHERGVFDVPRDKIEVTCWTNLSKQSGSCVGWFTPKLPT